MTGLLPAGLAAAAVAAALLREGAASRLPRVLAAAGPGADRPGSARRPGGSSGAGPSSRVVWPASLLAGTAIALLVAGPVGLLLGGVVAAAGPTCLRRLQPSVGALEDAEVALELPLALDLLAACLSGGASLHGAVSAVSAAVPGACAVRLGRVAGALAVGTPPHEAWQFLAGHLPPADDPTPAGTAGYRSPGRLARATPAGGGAAGAAARALARAAEGGAPVAASASRIAAAARADAAATAGRAARRAGVLAVAPLGLCFLPAFMLLGVVPAVVGLATPLLAGL